MLYSSRKIKNYDEVLNLINGFLRDKNSFIFESVEKGKIKVDIQSLGKIPTEYGNLTIIIPTKLDI